MGLLARLDNRSGNLVKLLPYASLTQTGQTGLMHNRNGTFEIGVELTVPNTVFSGLSPVLGAARHLLQSCLPENSRLRLISEVTPAPMGCLECYRARHQAQEVQLKALLEARYQQFTRDWEQGRLRSYRSYCTVRLGTPLRTFKGLTGAQLAAREREAEDLLEQLMRTLDRADFHPRPLSAQDMFALCFRYFNPDFTQTTLGPFEETHQYYPQKAITRIEGLNPSSLCAQLAKTPISNAALAHLVVGGKYVKLFALHTVPGRETYAGMMQATEAAGPHYTVVTDMFIAPAQKALGHLTARARRFEGAAHTDNYYVDPDTRVLMHNSEAALTHAYETGDRFLKMSVGLILFDESPQALNRRAVETYAALSAIPGNPFMPLAHGCLTPYLNFAPLGGRDHDQKVTLTTSNATHFMPVSGPWLGTDQAVALYLNRYYSPTQFDPFDRSADAYNGLVIGQTGSGKTFFMQHLLSEFLADPSVQVIIIDRGSGYRPLVRACEGAVVELTVGGHTSINPFDLPAGQLAPSDEDKMQLLHLLRAMIPGQPSPSQEIEDALLMAAITQVYSYAYKHVGGKATFVTPTLSDFIRKLYTLDEVNSLHVEATQRDLAKNLAMRLQLWTGDSALGRFVDRATTVPLEGSRLIYYDTEGLRSNPQLKAVGTLLISQLVWNRVRANPSQQTMVVLDEGWAMVQGSEAGRDFVAEMFRRFRTTGSGIWALSQSYADFADQPGIVNNVQNLFLLKSNADERELWKDKLNLPQRVIDLAAQVTNAKRHFSEALCLVRRGETFQGNIIALHPTPLDYWTFSTDTQDKAKREGMLAHHPSLEQALEHLEAA